MTGLPRHGVNRRAWLTGTSSALALAALPLHASNITDEIRGMLHDLFGQAETLFAHVSVELPALAENGNAVPFGVAVGKEAGAIGKLAVIAPQNPNPLLAVYQPAANAPVHIRTRIRLAGDQQVLAVAAPAKGPLIAGGAQIVVTEAACLDFLI